jgi:hypothetical protein
MTYGQPATCYYCEQENFNAEEKCPETPKGELTHAETKWCEYCEETSVDYEDGDSDSCARCYWEAQQELRDRNWDYYHA